MRKQAARKKPAGKQSAKEDFPVGDIRRYLEPGPIVLVSSAHGGETNIMTMGWHTVMEFTPSLVGCIIAGGNHSHRLIRDSGECVINLPTTKLLDTAVGIGNCSGADVDKFDKFGLTAAKAARVEAPARRVDHANAEGLVDVWLRAAGAPSSQRSAPPAHSAAPRRPSP